LYTTEFGTPAANRVSRNNNGSSTCNWSPLENILNQVDLAGGFGDWGANDNWVGAATGLNKKMVVVHTFSWLWVVGWFDLLDLF